MSRARDDPVEARPRLRAVGSRRHHVHRLRTQTRHARRCTRRAPAASRIPDDARRDRAPRHRPGPLLAVVAGSGLGPAAVAGVGMSFERGRGLAVRTALLGTLVAVAGVVAAATFGVSLRHLVERPAEQGWNWDVVVG